MTPVYIAAPFAGAVAENVRRANALCLLAVRQGLAPVCIHAAVAAGAYGDDAVPEDRAAGLRVAVALAAMVAEATGALWVLERDDGTLSSGCVREVAAYADAWMYRLPKPDCVRWRWTADGPVRR